MSRVLVVETKPSRNNLKNVFDFEFDHTHLTSQNLKKVLKKDVEIDRSLADDYDWVIVVGSEPFKFFTGKSSVTEYAGKVVNDKFIATINPAMLTFKPEARSIWENSVKAIQAYVTGEKEVRKYDGTKFHGINDKQEALDFIRSVIEAPYEYAALDCETSGLYPRDGYVLGVSLCGAPDTGAYINAEVIDNEVSELLQFLFYKKTIVFHNAKFDLAMLQYHFHWEFPSVEDTMLLHYALDERSGTHGLKQLALQYTEYGDYEEDLHNWIKDYTKKNNLLKSQFSWEFIPFEVMYPYAAIDSCVTFLLYNKFRRAVNKNPKLKKLYEQILIPGMRFLEEIQDNGVPFDIERLKLAQETMDGHIEEYTKQLYSHDIVLRFEEDQGDKFNPNSVQQLRKLLFDYVGLQPTGIKTGTGAHSTNAEVLGILSEQHEIPDLILKIRKDSKIKNTYLDKIIPQLNRDGRLRTNFNLHGTTSGRLSSSGKLNMQQLPRDNPAVKGCIKAKEGYKIVSMDLTTAEVYIAAVLSGDTELQNVFKLGGNFHSQIAKRVFKLDCEVELVEKFYKDKRQAAKAVTFGILYGAGAPKIASQITKDSGKYFSKMEAQEVIDDYFRTFWRLKKWLDEQEKLILARGYAYSHFGRKRRLRNIKSDNQGVVMHEIRSGINFLIQSPSSDINLIAAMEMQNDIKISGMDAKIFALVHDSILAEVREDQVENYCRVLKDYVESDRGLTIPGCPIGTDFEIGDDYSFGKFEELYLQDDRLVA
jgi:DNA polymerase I-like protein with 3'-5' exonuclease and polymerase domains